MYNYMTDCKRNLRNEDEKWVFIQNKAHDPGVKRRTLEVAGSIPIGARLSHTSYSFILQYFYLLALIKN